MCSGPPVNSHGAPPRSQLFRIAAWVVDFTVNWLRRRRETERVLS
jgi:hypothetical protein